MPEQIKPISTIVEMPFNQKKPIDAMNVDIAVLKKTVLDRIIPYEYGLKLPAWAIDGVIPGGIGVISGVPGVGKTTAVVPLALCMAGIIAFQTKLKIKRRRKIVIFTEDPEQIHRILYGICKWTKIGDNATPVDPATIAENIVIIHAHRQSAAELVNDIDLVTKEYSTMSHVFGLLAPLVILDTTSSNIALNNENDNAEVSTAMSQIKEYVTQSNLLLWLITHLPKTAAGLSIDDLKTHTARGAQAWTGDANWAAILAKEDPDDPNSATVLKMIKERVGLNGSECRFQTVFHHEEIMDIDNQYETVMYPVVSIGLTSYKLRKSDELSRKNDEYFLEVVAGMASELESRAAQRLRDPNISLDDHFVKKEIKAMFKGKTDKKDEAIERWILNKQLEEYDIPVKERANHHRLKGLRLVSTDDF